MTYNENEHRAMCYKDIERHYCDDCGVEIDEIDAANYMLCYSCAYEDEED